MSVTNRSEANESPWNSGSNTLELREETEGDWTYFYTYTYYLTLLHSLHMKYCDIHSLLLIQDKQLDSSKY